MVNLSGKTLSVNIASRFGLPKGMKVLRGTADRPRLAVNESRIPRTCMALFRGWQFSADLSSAERVVVKVSPNAPEDRGLIQEAEILGKLSNVAGFPGLIDQGEVITSDLYDKKRSAPYLVMPELPGRDLDELALTDWKRSFPSRQSLARLTAGALAELADRLAELHQLGVVHRDVKPNNALHSEEHGVALIDFGSANYLKAAPRTDETTVGFYPPELLLAPAEQEDVRTDVYSFGLTCTAMLTGSMGLLYQGMENIFRLSGFDMMFRSREEIVRKYLAGIMAMGEFSLERILQESNLPPELKTTSLGRYLVQLFHPKKELRPQDFSLIAEELRRLGGEFETIELWGRLQSKAD